MLCRLFPIHGIKWCIPQDFLIGVDPIDQIKIIAGKRPQYKTFGLDHSAFLFAALHVLFSSILFTGNPHSGQIPPSIGVPHLGQFIFDSILSSVPAMVMVFPEQDISSGYPYP